MRKFSALISALNYLEFIINQHNFVATKTIIVKTKTLNLIIVIILLGSAISMNAYSDGIQITWLECNETNSVDDIPNLHRVPPICCEISLKDGVKDANTGCALEQTVGYILKYEICDLSGEILESFSDEYSFLTTLFSLPEGSYIVRFTTQDYVLTGSVDL